MPLTDDEFLTIAHHLTQQSLRDRIEAGRSIGLDLDAEGNIINTTVEIRMARSRGEWVGIAECWPQGTAAHHESEAECHEMVMRACYRVMEEMYSGRRVARMTTTLQLDLKKYTDTLLRTN